MSNKNQGINGHPDLFRARIFLSGALLSFFASSQTLNWQLKEEKEARKK
jgi:hypothetical protein